MVGSIAQIYPETVWGKLWEIRESWK